MQIVHALWAFDPSEYYARVECPVLIVNAVNQGSTLEDIQPYAHVAARMLRKVNMVWMHDTTHDIPWHRPEMLLKVFDIWL